MAEHHAATLEGDSVEQVAFKLLVLIGTAEGKMNAYGKTERDLTDRAWILDTYRACLTAVKGHR
jgi:hypothetical protein